MVIGSGLHHASKYPQRVTNNIRYVFIRYIVIVTVGYDDKDDHTQMVLPMMTLIVLQSTMYKQNTKIYFPHSFIKSQIPINFFFVHQYT